MRLLAADVAMIDRAAQLQGRSRTEFVRDAAVRVAEETLMENSLIRMSEADHAAFVEAITAPAAPVPAIVELSQRVAPLGASLTRHCRAMTYDGQDLASAAACPKGNGRPAPMCPPAMHEPVGLRLMTGQLSAVRMRRRSVWQRAADAVEDHGREV